MRWPFFKNLGLLALAFVGIAARSDAGTIDTAPPGLSPGDTYRLVFVTLGYTDALSTNIADYNNFVTSQADGNPSLAALGATWTCICSTEAISAATNIGTTTSGIYTLDGNEVADGTAALFDTGTTFLLNPIDINQYGDVWPIFVWDGTLPNGQSEAGYALGDATPFYGASVYTSVWYLQSPYGSLLPADTGALYAISSELTVVPEPSTIGLTALGGALLLLARRRKLRIHLAARKAPRPSAPR